MKRLSALFMVVVMLLCSPTLLSYAGNESVSQKPTSGIESAVPGYGESSANMQSARAALINRIDLTIAQVENRGLRVNYATGTGPTMAEIGCKEITFERWDGDEWVEVYQTERIATNTFFTSGSVYSPTNLPAGYYYRATAIHYAKEQGWFFPSKDEFYNETSYILLQ